MSKQDDDKPHQSFDFSPYSKQLHSKRNGVENGPAELQKNMPAVQKVRWGRTWRGLGVILPPFIIVGLFAIYMATPLSKVREVTVHGSELTTNQAIIDASKLDDKVLIPGLALHEGKVEHRVASKFPEIKTVKLRIHRMRDVSLTVTEYKASGYYHDKKGYHLIMSTGKVLPGASETPKLGMPVFTGFGRGRALRQISKLLDQFPPAISRDVSEVVLSRGGGNPYQITIAMNDGNRIVADQRTILKKIKYYPSMVAQIKGTGTVDLEVVAFYTPNKAK